MANGESTPGDEASRILAEYERRGREIPADYYSFARPAVLFAYQQRVRAVLRTLSEAGMLPLRGRAVLEVGCGRGDWLADFEMWGAARRDLAGIELHPERGKEAQARLAAQRDDGGRTLAPGADVRIGDASALPWADASFDIVLQSTVFTSILDAGMRRAVAAEMARVLRPGGIVLWYDFLYDNPRNPNVRGVKAAEVRALFPGFAVRLRRITLAPPIARRLVPWTWIGAALLEKSRVLNTHYLGALRKATGESATR